MPLLKTCFFLAFLFFTALISPGKATGQYEVVAQEPLQGFIFYEDTTNGQATEPTSIKSFKGKVVLLHFWTFACPNCAIELPSLNDFSKTFPADTFAVISINLDAQRPGQIANFHAERQLFNLIPYGNVGLARPKFRGLPTTYVLNKNGDIVGRIEGVCNWQDPAIKRAIKRVVDQPYEKTPDEQPSWQDALKKFFDRMKNMLFAHAAESASIKTTTKRQPQKVPMSTTHSSLLIIGSGPAGYTAAIYAARANLKPLQILGVEAGGQLMITTDVENFPGFAKPVQGPWLMQQMQEQAKNVGAQLINDHINKVDLSKRPFTCYGDQGTYTCDALIIATGAQARWMNIPSETKYRGYGVSGCATCDAPFFRGKTVAVVGGGNTAVEEALHLTRFCEKVYLIHRRDELRADKISQDRLFQNNKVEIIWDTVVEEILGNDNPKTVKGLRLKNTKTNQETSLTVDGVFMAIGHTPRTEVFKGQLNLDAEGYIMTQGGPTQTNVAGVFAAGDVQDKVYRQAVTAAALGCMAAIDAEHYLGALETAAAGKKTTQK